MPQFYISITSHTFHVWVSNIHYSCFIDLTMPVDVEFNEGDQVRVDLNLDTYKPLLTEYGGWIPDLEKVMPTGIQYL
jgi:hypothetical protein